MTPCPDCVHLLTTTTGDEQITFPHPHCLRAIMEPLESLRQVRQVRGLATHWASPELANEVVRLGDLARQLLRVLS